MARRQQRAQPVVERGEQRLVAEVGPVPTEAAAGEAGPGLERAGRRRPPQGSPARRPARGPAGRRSWPGPAAAGRRPASRTRASSRCSVRSTSVSRRRSTPARCTSVDVGAGQRFHVGLVEGGGQPDPVVGAAVPRAGPGRPRPGRATSRSGSPAADRDGPTGAQPEAAAAPGLGDAVRVGQAERRAEGGRRRRASGRRPARRARSRPRRLHGAAAVPVDARVVPAAVQHEADPLGDVGVQLLGAASKEVALLEQGGQHAGLEGAGRARTMRARRGWTGRSTMARPVAVGGRRRRGPPGGPAACGPRPGPRAAVGRGRPGPRPAAPQTASSRARSARSAEAISGGGERPTGGVLGRPTRVR